MKKFNNDNTLPDIKHNTEKNLLNNRNKTTNVNILLNRVRLDRKKDTRKKIIFLLLLLLVISAVSIFAVI